MKIQIFIVLMFLCFSVQAKVTRCVNPTTGLVTYTDKRCDASEKPNTVTIHRTSGANMGGPPPTQSQSPTSSAPRISVVPRYSGCKRRCPYNGKCLEFY